MELTLEITVSTRAAYIQLLQSVDDLKLPFEYTIKPSLESLPEIAGIEAGSFECVKGGFQK